MIYSLILACTLDGGIGLNNKIPWHIPEDLQLFKKITTDINCYVKKNAVIMGRKTWESLPSRPLKDRFNIIITSKPDSINTSKDIIAFSNIEDAFVFCNDNIYIDKVFVIGGKSLYDLCLNDTKLSRKIDNIYLSIINKREHCDKFIDLKKIIRNYKYYNIYDIIFNSNFIHIKLIAKAKLQ